MKIHRLLLIAVLVFTADGPQATDDESDDAVTLAEQLLLLANKHQFSIQGIEKTESKPFKSISGDWEPKIKRLLLEFNYMFIRAEDGNLERLIILDQKSKGPKKIVLDTKKQGHQHIIVASIKGISNDWITVDLLVDTGADRIVLPSSLIELLGYIAEKLENRKLQTVNGLVEAKIGNLDAIEIGNEIIRDVGVAFVPEESLGNVKLLGMNVLSHYRLTIDDDLQQIILIKR